MPFRTVHCLPIFLALDLIEVITSKKYKKKPEGNMRYYASKIIIFALFALLAQSAFCQTSQVKITSYDIKVSLNLPASQLQVAASLEMEKADTVSQFEVILNSDAQIGAIRSETKEGPVNLSYKFVGKDTLRLTVPSELVATRNLTLDFMYTLPMKGLKGDVMLIDRGHRWYPLILDQIAKFKLTASVPPGYDVFAPGDFVEKKDLHQHYRFVWESKIPVFKLSLVVAKSNFYKETFRKCDNKEIRYYSSTSSDQEAMEQILSEACSAFKFYNQSIGEYPHNRLTLVEIPGLGGTNISTAFLMVDSTFVDEFKQGNYDQLLLSIACQWMASGVFFKYEGKGFWFLQLSLPHYLRLMYLEKIKGVDAFTKDLQRGLDAYKEIAGTDQEVSIMEVDFPNTKEKARTIYGKGPYVIDKVRRQVGDENWDKFLKDIYTNFKGKILTYDEFINYLSKYDRDGTAVAKLNKMVSGKGIPEE
jgi:hypothetical protein